jgi:hypothetical protein
MEKVKINWRDLKNQLHDSDKCDFPDDESFIQHMQEFRDHGTILDYFFDEPLKGQSTDPDDAYSWGPEQEDIDLTGLPD